ncbi:hypothetical protein BJP25_16970 [Actinokineospora bangkokensis]|uniref:Peptidase S9 prolyl oligopeptidase catalytic domain-containing protein n=1 Tax=Actinokineospora bangkokensis TaxID=1193682 RepID=A0A1Q9LMG3_9PSEU|nr:hypothetical protein BJP25_16970 [Actinokineospora bangkokensis]
MLGWAGDHHVVLWLPTKPALLWVLDTTHRGAVARRLRVLGRPVRCRVTPGGGLEVLVVLTSRGAAELCLYRADDDTYAPIPGTRGVRGVGGWFDDTIIVEGDRLSLLRLSGGIPTEVPVSWPDGVRAVRSVGRAGLTGIDGLGRSVPGILDPATGGVRWFHDQAGQDAVDLAPSGSRLLTMASADHRFVYRVLDRRGALVGDLVPPPGLATEVTFARDEHHLVGLHQSPAAPPRPAHWALPAASGPAEGGPLRWFHRLVDDVPEWVFTPRDREPRGTVVFLHGGPRGQLRQLYDPVVEALVLAGWAVVGPNYPGSSGYGAAYRERGRGDWGGEDAEAVARRLRSLAADGRPVHLYGQSYGGYLALLVATTTPVAAVAVWAPVTDLPDLSAGMSGVRRRWLDDELGELLGDRARLWERSPLSRAPALAAVPLLIGHGTRDDRSPVAQSHRLLEAVRAVDPRAPVRFFDHPGGHSIPDWSDWNRALVDHYTEAEERTWT